MPDDGGYKEWQMQQTIDALTEVAEQLREHHKLAVEQWTLEAQQVKELEDKVHELRAENEAFRSALQDIADDPPVNNYFQPVKRSVTEILQVAKDALRGEGEK